MLTSMFLHAFMVENVFIKIEGYIRKIATFLNVVDAATQCQTSLIGIQNTFPDFLIDLLEGHLYNDYFLTSDLLFILFLYAFISTLEF